MLYDEFINLQDHQLLETFNEQEDIDALTERMCREAAEGRAREAELPEKPPRQKKRKRDRAFKPSLTLPGEKLDRLVPVLDGLTDGDRRPRNIKEARRHRRRLGAIIASVIKAGVAGKACHYSRDQATYRGHSIYKPDWLTSKGLLKDIEALEAAGLLECKVGDFGGPKMKGKRRSTMKATPLLGRLLQECGISADDVLTSLDDYIPVIVKEPNGKLYQYDPADPTIADIAMNLQSYNSFMQDICVTYVDKDGARKQMPFTWLDRTFNSPSLLKGGRFFNGWWENIKKELRPSIAINGRPTVEIDFVGMHIRMLYHRRDIDYPHDPYEIPSLKALAKQQGVKWKKIRKKIKRLTNTLLNAREEFDGWRWDFYPLKGMSYEEVGEIIRSHHAQLEGDFFQGLGLDCMQIESNIMEAVMKRAVEAGIAVLPIHDSARVAVEDEEMVVPHGVV